MGIASSLSWEAQQSAVACARLFLASLEPFAVPETGVFGTQVQLSALAKQQSCSDPSLLIKWIENFV